jgi:enamine deaminase RidA (YjgF/YER057c/UK114 family)
MPLNIWRRWYANVYREFVEQSYPCHTTLGVEALAFPEYLCEVEVELPVGDRDP